MKVEPVIIIVTYNRPASLLRLLDSIAKARFDEKKVKLIISIDQSHSDLCLTVAEKFKWPHGEKEIIKHETHFGLKKHILSCGDLTEKYGSAILLEDDMFVSPYFYLYACEAGSFYDADQRIAGISLYNYQLSESTFYPFQAIDDNSDVYFMQVASSWGQLWNKNQWLDFKDWLNHHQELNSVDILPNYILEWGQHSWKKHFIHYLIATGKFFVFPRLSLTTNFEEPGTNSNTKNVFQVPIQISDKVYVFKKCEDSGAKYDAWFEIYPECLNRLNPELSTYDYAVNLYGSKQNKTIQNKYVLTSAQKGNAILSFTSELFPLESNVIVGLKGASIGLYKGADKQWLDIKLPMPGFQYSKKIVVQPKITVVLLVLEFSMDLFQNTINSILSQSLVEFELVISCKQNEYDQIQKALSYAGIQFKIMLNDDTSTFSQLLQKGIEAASSEVLCWIHQGTVFEKKCFHRVNTIFEQYPLVNWIRGINEVCETLEEYDRIRTFKYRVTVGDVYDRIKKNELDFSTELHFFKRHLFLNNNIVDYTMHGMFSQLIVNIQMLVVVSNFGQIAQKQPKVVSPHVKQMLLYKFKPIQIRTSFKSRCIYWLIRTPLFNNGSWQWYLSSDKNYPDVLRYDEINQTYYFAKF